MKIQIFQHVAFEGPAYIKEIAGSGSHDLQVCRFFEGEPPLSTSEYDMLIVMGGPMNIYEDKIFPWLTTEKTAIEQAIKAGKTVLGFCFGAQLIADVLGAKVYKNKEKEIGWFPISRIQPGTGNPPLQFLPDIATVFHWHGDTFGLPSNSTHLYSSEATENQAFLFGKNVLAMQFHLELQQQSILDLTRFCKSDLTKGRYIMSGEEMLEYYSTYEASNKKTLRNLIRYFTKGNISGES